MRTCTYKECMAKLYRYGLCARHYAMSRALGYEKGDAITECEVKECGFIANKGETLCNGHSKRMRKYGTPTPPDLPPFIPVRWAKNYKIQSICSVFKCSFIAGDMMLCSYHRPKHRLQPAKRASGVCKRCGRKLLGLTLYDDEQGWCVAHGTQY